MEEYDGKWHELTNSPSEFNSSEQQDSDLVERLNSGEAEAFDLLYLRYHKWVQQLAFRFTGHEDDALDVVQETFSYLISKFPGFTLTARMTTFLYPAVKNLAIAANKKRRQNTGEAVDSEQLIAQSSAFTRGEHDEIGQALAQELEKLSESHREIILLRVVDGLSLNAIAELNLLPLGTVKSRLHHALSKLRNNSQLRALFGS